MQIFKSPEWRSRWPQQYTLSVLKTFVVMICLVQQTMRPPGIRNKTCACSLTSVYEQPCKSYNNKVYGHEVRVPLAWSGDIRLFPNHPFTFQIGLMKTRGRQKDNRKAACVLYLTAFFLTRPDKTSSTTSRSHSYCHRVARSSPQAQWALIPYRCTVCPWALLSFLFSLIQM